jgi:O-methyltransferase domain/Dimerisation domain
MDPMNALDEITSLRQLIMGFRISQMIFVAAKLDLADHLARAPCTARELAPTVGVDADALHRLLRALASLGVFAETTGGQFVMTSASELLRRDSPGSLRSTALLYGDKLLWGVYGQLSHAVETGSSAFEHLYGQSFYDYLSEHQVSARLFHEAMTGFSELEAAAILAGYDFSAVSTVVDVGGGQGALMAAVLRAYPGLTALIFDRSPPTADTQRLFDAADIVGRAKFIQGDFFSAVPAGGDLYVLKSIIHNWADEPAKAILRRCHAAMSTKGRLLLAERVIPPGNLPSEAKLFDINMLVTVGGRERTEEEYKALLRAANLELTQIIATTSHLSLVEAAMSS